MSDEPCEHQWHRPTESVTMCRLCGLDANELRLGLRADEASTTSQS